MQDAAQQTANSDRLYDLLEAEDFSGLETLFRCLLREHSLRVVHEQRHRRLRGLLRERVLLDFAATGFDVTVEDSSSRGRADMAVRFGGNVCLFDKVVEQASAGAALAQLRERGYADKYRASGERIHLIGVEFSKETRNVTAFEVERA